MGEMFAGLAITMGVLTAGTAAIMGIVTFVGGIVEHVRARK